MEAAKSHLFLAQKGKEDNEGPVLSDFSQFISYPTLLLVVAFLLYLVTLAKLNAFSFALGGLLMLEVTHHVIEFVFDAVFTSEYVAVWEYYAWYISFAVTDFIFAIAVSLLVKKLNLHFDKATILLVVAVAMLGAIQLLRMFERLLIDSATIGTLYQHGIPTINLIISIVVLSVVIISLFSPRRGSAL